MCGWWSEKVGRKRGLGGNVELDTGGNKEGREGGRKKKK